MDLGLKRIFAKTGSMNTTVLTRISERLLSEDDYLSLNKLSV
jgi:hypothetical protein